VQKSLALRSKAELAKRAPRQRARGRVPLQRIEAVHKHREEPPPRNVSREANVWAVAEVVLATIRASIHK
jgi:hypothetical protein